MAITFMISNDSIMFGAFGFRLAHSYEGNIPRGFGVTVLELEAQPRKPHRILAGLHDHLTHNLSSVSYMSRRYIGPVHKSRNIVLPAFHVVTSAFM